MLICPKCGSANVRQTGAHLPMGSGRVYSCGFCPTTGPKRKFTGQGPVPANSYPRADAPKESLFGGAARKLPIFSDE